MAMMCSDVALHLNEGGANVRDGEIRSDFPNHVITRICVWMTARNRRHIIEDIIIGLHIILSGFRT